MFDFGIKAALESYGTWRVYLRHCGRTAFDLYPGYRFSRHYIDRVRARTARPQLHVIWRTGPAWPVAGSVGTVVDEAEASPEEVARR
jgi:hypothetical protein